MTEHLSIGSVAEAAGVSVELLRAWEARYGFPVPERTGHGHRRYGSDQVEAIRQVQRDRDGGLSLAAAIQRARSRSEHADTSLFARLRRRHPEQPVQRFTKRELLAVTRAVEDECTAQGGPAHVVGSFQEERYYRQSERRWRELARTASFAVVLADFVRNRTRRGAATEVAVEPGSALRREWAVVCAEPHLWACAVGVELAAEPSRDGDRRFEALVSTDRAVVHEALRIGAALATGVDGADVVAEALPPPPDPTIDLRNAAALVGRAVIHLDGGASRPAR